MPLNEVEKHEIILEDWHYICDEEFRCEKYGTRIIVNGKIIAEDCSTISAIEDILKALNIDFELKCAVESNDD